LRCGILSLASWGGADDGVDHPDFLFRVAKSKRLKVSATVLPPDAVTKITFAPPRARKASAGSLAALSM
jgi:hypothetical protein